MKKENSLESDYVLKVVNALIPFLNIEQEVKSDCKNGRIDLIATTPTGERFGIECKRADEKRGEKIGDFIKQAIRYSDYKFNGVRIPIFLAPALSYNYFLMNQYTKDIDGELWHRDRHQPIHTHHSINGMLGSLGVGEIRKGYNYFYFSFSNKIIWSSQKEYNSNKIVGLHPENYINLIKKINNGNTI